MLLFLKNIIFGNVESDIVTFVSNDISLDNCITI